MRKPDAQHLAMRSQKGREDKELFVLCRSLLSAVSIKRLDSTSSQPLSNCHRTFLKNQRNLPHIGCDISSLSLSLSLPVTQTFIHSSSWKEKMSSAIGGLSKETYHWTNWATFSLHSSPLYQNLFSVKDIGKAERETPKQKRKNDKNMKNKRSNATIELLSCSN